MNSEAGPQDLTDEDYGRLLEFRDGLRRFFRWSTEQAKQARLTSAQYQLLLAVRGHDGPPSVGEVASHLLLRHHSAVELVDRVERAGLVRRVADEHDHRVVRLKLTVAGRTRLAQLATAHVEELSRLRPRFDGLWRHLPDTAP